MKIYIYSFPKIAFKVLKPLTGRKKFGKKRIVIRSWFRDNTIKEHEEFKDRNFGSLPDRLRSMNYDVWILPMTIGLPISIKQFYEKKYAFLGAFPQAHSSHSNVKDHGRKTTTDPAF